MNEEEVFTAHWTAFNRGKESDLFDAVGCIGTLGKKGRFSGGKGILRSFVRNVIPPVEGCEGGSCVCCFVLT